MKNKLVSKSFLVLMLLGISSVYGAEKSPAPTSEAKNVQFVPMVYDKAKSQWNILLSKQGPGDWEVFYNPTPVVDSVQKIAHQNLQKQTNHIYEDFKLKHFIQSGETKNGDSIVFGQVPYISGRNLYQTARNKLKDDFAWVSVDRIISSAGDVPVGKANINRGTLKMLRYFLPKALVHRGPSVVDLSALPDRPPSEQHFSKGKSFPSQEVPKATVTRQNPQHGKSGRWSESNFAQGQIVYFYERGKPYYEFTNFYDRAPFKLDGDSWKTSEHYFQAQKFPKGSSQYKAVLNAQTARDVFTLANGRNGIYKNSIRSDWKSVSMQVMKDALIAKVTQNKPIADLLRNTGVATLVEDAGANDPFWGAGQDMDGQNKLGLLLMGIRDDLNKGSYGGWPQ